MATDIRQAIGENQRRDAGIQGDKAGQSRLDRAAKSGKYNINQYGFPSDVGADDMLHYVCFEINVRGKSSFNKDNRQYAVQTDPNAANRSSGDLGKAGAAGAVVGGAATGLKLGLLGGALGGAASGLAYGLGSLLKPDTKYRISDAITLHIGEPPTVKYNMNYANKDLGTLAGIVSGGVINTLMSGEAAAAGVLAFAKLPSIFGTNLKDVISASSKTSLNPFREVIFESVDFRSYNMKFRLMPRSAAEADKIKNIVNLFKFHMHPELSDNKLFFIYPSEFQITYFYGGGPNPYFHKCAPAVLENMEVTYGGEGQFSAFKDGKPTEVNLTLNFREVEILTKNMIGEDGSGG